MYEYLFEPCRIFHRQFLRLQSLTKLLNHWCEVQAFPLLVAQRDVMSVQLGKGAF